MTKKHFSTAALLVCTAILNVMTVRAQAPAPAPSPAVTRIACIGDSITRGAGLDDADTQSFPAVMAEILGPAYEVRNYGFNSRTGSLKGDFPYMTSEKYPRVKAWRPDIITIMLGTNDTKPGNWNGEAFRQGMDDMVKDLKALPNNPRVIILTPTPASWNDPSRPAPHGIRDSVIVNCIIPDLKWLATRHGVELVDLYAPFDFRRELFPDQVHPGAGAARMLATFVSAACLQKAPWEIPNSYIAPAELEVRRNVAQWQDLKFGMFIHWGTYSQRGIIESWSLCPANVDWQFKSRPRDKSYDEYVRGYEDLQHTFNPVEFDPGRWAAAARDAGMRYVVFTTKHHDGFNMFDTAQTDYKITDPSCPFSTDPRANIALNIFDAFRARGLQAGAYFSIADWHHDDYWWKFFPPYSTRINYDTSKFPEKWPRYQDFMVAQIDELTSGYGPLNMLWFDLCDCSNESPAPVPWERIAATARANQPGIMMVARHTHTIWENYCTPEQTIPDEILDYPWESCITMTYSWSWRPNLEYKSVQTILGMLVNIVSRGGNMLLNVGPDGRGRLDDDAYDRLAGIGRWMKVNSGAIYGTQAVMNGTDEVYYTRKGGTLYAFAVAKEGENEIPSTIFLPLGKPAPGSTEDDNLAYRLLKEGSGATVSMLGAKGRLKWEPCEGGILVSVPSRIRKARPCDYIWTLEISAKD